MRAYGIIKSTFWLRGSGKRLRGNPEAQVLALYLMTCSQGTMCGIFHVALPTVAHDTGIALARIADLLVTLDEIVTYDPDEELCWVPNAAREQVGTSLSTKDKKRPGVLRELKQFGHHPFVGEFFRMYMEPYLLDAEWSIWNSGQPSKCGKEAPSKPLRSPMQGSVSEADAPSKPPVQVQEQVQEQVQAQDHVVILSASARDEVPLVDGSLLDGSPPTRRDNHIPDPLARAPSVPPAPRRGDFRTLRPPEWSPSDPGVAYARELGLDDRDISETITELRNWKGTRAYTVDWWDTKWNTFVQNRAKWKNEPGSQRRGKLTHDPSEAARAREAMDFLRGDDEPVLAEVVG